MNQEQVFIKMNQDTHPRYMAKGDYRYALNCRVGLSVDGSDLTVNNVHGTETCTVYEVWQDDLIHNAGLPTTGVNKLIGSVEWEQEGRLAIFVYNSLGSHCIFMYDDEDFKIYKLIESSLLGFSDDHERLVTGAAFIHDDLYFTDANGEIKHINLVDIKKYETYASIPIDAITLIRRPPIKAPRITRKSDNLIISSTIKGKSFQFATRYVFADGSRSVLSPASELAFHIIPNAIDSYSITHFLNGSNDALKPIIDSVEFLVRDFYTLNWKIFKTVLFETNTDIATELTVDFKDDGAFSFIDVADSNRLYDTIPVNVKALEYLEDRLFIGNFSDTWGNGLLKLIKDNLSDINQVETDNSTSLNPLGLVDTFGNTQLKYSNNATYGQRVFKPDSTYGIGIVLYDEYRRKTLVLGYDVLTIKTNQQQYSIANRTSMEFNINPLAIKTYLNDISNKSAYKLSSYAVVRTENLTSNWFVQGRVENVYYVIYVNNEDLPAFVNKNIDGANITEEYNNVINNVYNYTDSNNLSNSEQSSLANEIWFDIRNWTLYNTKIPYQFTEGDILTVLQTDLNNKNKCNYKYKIKYQRSFFIVVDNLYTLNKIIGRSASMIDINNTINQHYSQSYFLLENGDYYRLINDPVYGIGRQAPSYLFFGSIKNATAIAGSFQTLFRIGKDKLLWSYGFSDETYTLNNDEFVSIYLTWDNKAWALTKNRLLLFFASAGVLTSTTDLTPYIGSSGTPKQIMLTNSISSMIDLIGISWKDSSSEWNYSIFDKTGNVVGTETQIITNGRFVDRVSDVYSRTGGCSINFVNGIGPQSNGIGVPTDTSYRMRIANNDEGFLISECQLVNIADEGLSSLLISFQCIDDVYNIPSPPFDQVLVDYRYSVIQTVHSLIGVNIETLLFNSDGGSDIGITQYIGYGIVYKKVLTGPDKVKNRDLNNNKVKITDACGVRRPSAGLNYFGVNWESETKINDVDKTNFNNRGTFSSSPDNGIGVMGINFDIGETPIDGPNNPILDYKSMFCNGILNNDCYAVDFMASLVSVVRNEANKSNGGSNIWDTIEIRRGLGVISDNTIADAFNYGCKIEISSPRQPQENNLYYEVGNPHIYTNVDSAVQNVKFGSSDDGDCFIIQKEYRGYWWNTINETILSMNPDQNNVTQWIKVNSGINTELKPSKILNSDYDSAIRFGGQYLSGTNVNDINIFLALDEKIMPNEYGAIMKLQNTSNTLEDGNVLLSVMTEETVSIYVNKVQFNDVSGQNVVATADTVLGTFRALRGSYGTRHPESVVQHNGNVYFFDWTKGEVLQYSTNGLDSISNKGMRTYWNNVAIAINKSITPINDKRASNFYIYGGVDSENGDILFTIIENTGGIRDTLAYTVKDQAWKTFYSYVPNGYGKVNNRMIALQIVEPANVDFVHLFNSERTRANVVIPNNRFMGTFYDSEIQTVFNQYPNENKNPLNITVHSDECWEVSEIKSDNVVNGNESISECLNNGVDMARIDQTWYGAILRDASTPIANALIEGDVMIGKYFLVKLVNKPSFNNVTTNKARLYKALLSFIKSFY